MIAPSAGAFSLSSNEGALDPRYSNHSKPSFRIEIPAPRDLSYEVSFDEGESYLEVPAGFSNVVSVLALDDGEHRLFYRYVSPSTAQYSASAELSFMVDTNAPEAPSSLQWAQGAKASTLSLTAQWLRAVSDDLAAQSVQFFSDPNCQVASGPPTEISTLAQESASFAAADNHSYSFQVSSTDRAGNKSLSACSPGVSVLVTTPSVAFASPVSNFFINLSNENAVTVSGTCQPEGQMLTIGGDIDATTMCQSGGSFSTDLDFTLIGDSDHLSITANLSDSYGNAAPQEQVTVIKDTAPPLVTGLADDTSATQSKTWSWGCSETACTYRFVVDTSVDTEPSGAFGASTSATANSGTGTYYLHVQAQDAAGNLSAVVHVAATIDNTPAGDFSIASAVPGDGHVTLSWNSSAGAASYVIKYGTSPGVYDQSYSNNASSPSDVVGLTNGTTYYFMVTAHKVGGDTNASSEASATPFAVTFNGWDNVLALGGRTHGDQSSLPVSQQLSDRSASVELKWKAMGVVGGSIASYKVYRATTSGGPYTLRATVTPSSPTSSYTDSEISNESSYYYVVRALVDSIEVTPSQADAEIKIIVPPTNMSLVHRWIANQEICSLMGRSVDREHDYRCDYTGPGNSGYHGANTGSGYYDLGHSYFVDTVELGCNYTRNSSGCGDGPCLQANGIAPAAEYGNISDVAYDRLNGRCYYKRDATTWIDASLAATSTERLALSSSMPGLPPLGYVGPINFCGDQSVSGLGTKHLLSRKLQLAASAWSPELNDISARESGINLNSGNGYCNSSSANGLDYASETSAIPSNYELLPGSATASVRSLRTGSTTTSGCVSRYGIQDLIGNMEEWLSDRVVSCENVNRTCTGAQSASDPSNYDFQDIVFSDYANNSGAAMSGWGFSSSSKVIIPLGAPVLDTVAAWMDAFSLGTGTDEIDPSKFYSDSYYLRADNNPGSSRTALAGGSWVTGSGSGRFRMNLDNTTGASGGRTIYRGMRCSLAAD